VQKRWCFGWNLFARDQPKRKSTFSSMANCFAGQRISAPSILM